MPPHCDSMDGPVVTAARRALSRNDVREVLPYVKKRGEAEIVEAFHRTISAHDGNAAANELADLYFCETVVRVHRAGEGAPYTGLKPAGLSTGPVIPAAERAIERGDPAELSQLLATKVRVEVERRLHEVVALRPLAERSVEDARRYVEASLGLQVWAHGVYLAAERRPHGEAENHIEGDPEARAEERTEALAHAH